MEQDKNSVLFLDTINNLVLFIINELIEKGFLFLKLEMYIFLFISYFLNSE
jgi:hypothetical protein